MKRGNTLLHENLTDDFQFVVNKIKKNNWFQFARTGTKPNLTNGDFTMKTLVTIFTLIFSMSTTPALAENKYLRKVYVDACRASYIDGGIPEIPKYELEHGKETFIRYNVSSYRVGESYSFYRFRDIAERAWDCYGEINWRRCVSDSNVQECIKLLKEEY